VANRIREFKKDGKPQLLKKKRKEKKKTFDEVFKCLSCDVVIPVITQ
jgi:hypothetical protein